MRYFIVLIIPFLLISCSQTLEFVGEPGTEIYKNYSVWTTIDQSGKAKGKISRCEYQAFLYAVPKNSEKKIPIGVNYKPCTRGFRKLGVVLFCYGPTMWQWMLLDQWSENYKYNKRQFANTEFNFRPINDKGFKRQVLSQQATSATNPSSQRYGSDKTVAASNWAGRVSGKYIVSGRLLQNNKQIERYSKMSVVIEPIGNRSVEVNIYDENNQSYLEQAQTFNVSKDATGNFTLTLKGNNAAVINVDADGKLDYLHPNIKFGHQEYYLLFNGSKSTN